MKYYKILLTALAIILLAPACQDILEENPKTTFTNDYFKTPQGAQDGLNTAYSYLRYHYGVNPTLALNLSGTDEFTYGEQPAVNTSGDNLPHLLFGTYDINSEFGFLTTTFNRTFPIINLLNGLIEFIPNMTTLSDADKSDMMAQARYLRAHYYYLLVSQFGAVPTDLGSGHLVFNTLPYAGFNRPTKDDTEGLKELLATNYEVMITDLEYASVNLPMARPAREFRLSQAVALHMLSRIYLFRAYSGVSPNDQSDFQAAYDAAMTLIENPSAYGVELLQDFGDAYKQSNEYNREILFAAERIPMDNVNNEYTNPTGISDRENMAASTLTSNYESVSFRDGSDPIDGRPLLFQRPLRKLRPTDWLLNVAFADKVNDSRYHNSFRTVYTVESINEPGSDAYNTWLEQLPEGVEPGDTAFVMTDTDAMAAAINGEDVPYRAYGPSDWWTPENPTQAPQIYPGLKKFDDLQRATGNDASGRPMPIFKFGETFLLAAEAALQGNINGGAAEAARLINILRERAAYRPHLDDATLAARITAIQISAGDVDLDFILDERARELAGEGSRWPDLAMRGEDVFISRISLNEQAAAGVKAFHRLRPIPQEHLDRIQVTNPSEYQNPGY